MAVASTAVVAASLAVAPLTPASATTVPPSSLADVADNSWWGTNGRVSDIAVFGDRVYLGGSFDYLGPNTGHGAITDAATGAMIPDNPVISGPARVSISDGNGGFFVGGGFQKAGEFRPSLVHFNADGSVDPMTVQVKGDVYSMAMVGTNLLIGGKFSQVNDTTSTNIALIDPATGLKVPGFNGSINNTVRALVVSGSRIYAGGYFTGGSGWSARGLVALNAATGSRDLSFTGTVNANVLAMTANPATNQLFVGGDFTSAQTASWNSGSRSRLASFNLTGNLLNTWSPGADSTVHALTMSPDGAVFAGGQFLNAGGSAHPRLVKLSTASNVALPFDAQVASCFGTHGTKTANEFYPCTPIVGALSTSADTLYIGGLFSTVGGEVRHNAAAVDTTSGAVTTWDPRPSNRVYSMAVSGPQVFVGGDQTSAGGVFRKGLAAIDATTGALDQSFQQDTDNAVLTFTKSVDGTKLFLGGSFTTIGGVARESLAKLDGATGALDTDFTPVVNNTVLDMDVEGNNLYIGGKFTRVSGKARARAARVNATTGGADPAWIANTVGPSGKLRSNGMVQGIQVAPDGSKVYLGGPFTSINGTSVTGGIAVLSGADATFLPNRLGGVEGCSSVGPWVNRLYLSDDGQRLYGGDVCPDRIYQWDAVNLSSASKPTGLNWKTWCNGGMQGRVEINGHFYYGSHGGDRGRGGYCWAAPGGPTVDATRFMQFNADDGTLNTYAPQFDTAMGVWSFAELPGRGLLVGGDFTFAGDAVTVARGLAFFPGTP